MPSSARCTNSRAGQPAAAKRGAAQCADHPDEGAPSATGRQSQKSQKMIARPKAGQNRRLHRSADPRRAEARTRRSASKRSFLLDRARPVSLLARPKGAPAAPRAVGRGGARERAQFSPQAETELSGLCDDDNGGRIPRGSGPCGSRISRGRRSAAQIISGRLIAAPTSPRKLFRHRLTPAEAALTPPVG